jgi:hypothetical protein
MIESDDQVFSVINKIDHALEQLEDLEKCLVYYESQLGVSVLNVVELNVTNASLDCLDRYSTN